MVGAVPLGEDAAPISRRFCPNSAVDLAPISTILAPRSTTIGPRLRFDRGPRSPSIFFGSSRCDSAAKEVRSRLDRAPIAARSDRDRGVLPRLICTVRWLELQVIWRVTIARHCGRRIAIKRGVHRQPSISEDRDEGYCEQSGASISR